ncbi:glycosyltransferase, partial [Weissella cibaria]
KNELVVRGLAKPNDIFVSFPKVKKISQIYQEQIVETEKVVFFFPSTAMVYKNHKVILEALSLLPKDIKRKIQIIFTLTESELINLTEIKSIPEEIVLTGRVNKQEVAEILSRSILIFPSYIETFGLPILEGKQIERPLIVADVPVLRESVSDYEDVQYFNPFDSRHLANIISDFVKNRTITRSVGFDEESGINTKLDNLLTLVKGEMSRHAKN